MAHLLLWLALMALASASGPLQQAMGQQYRQHNNILDFQVPENAQPGYYLGQVRSADGRVPSLILPIKPTLESDLIAALQYNYTTGDLHTSAPLDREQRERYQFTAIVTELFTEVKCTVRVTDVNDNAPTFLMAQNETHVVLEVEEGRVGIRRSLPPAYDLDSPLYGIQQFQLTVLLRDQDYKKFSLVEHGAPPRPPNSNLHDDTAFGPGGNGSLLAGENPHLVNQFNQLSSVLIPSQTPIQPQAPMVLAASAGGAGPSAAAAISNAPRYHYVDIELNEPLDRENQSIYKMKVTAEDKGVIPMVSNLEVILKVIDINDNDPIFTEKLYECRVKEDELINTRLLRVEANDADEGANANIIYSIRNHTSTSSQSISSTTSDNNNNEVSTATAGRFSNGGNNKRTMQQYIPASGKLALRSQQQQDTQHASSDQQPSSLGKQFNSKQQQLAGGIVQEPLFHIDPIKGDLILSHSLDYESDQLHELVVEARDQGTPSRATTTIVRVYVIDVMDDPPQSNSFVQSNDNKHSTSGVSQGLSSEPSERAGQSNGAEVAEATGNYFQNFNLAWFAQINSSVLFIFVLVALIIVAFPVCFVKIKSHQPESEYNDTAGLTLTSNGGQQTKQSPNHTSGHGDGGAAGGALTDGHGHHRHDVVGAGHQRRINGSFAGLSGDGTFGGGGKSRYQFSDSSNLYYNLYNTNQQSRHHHNNHLHHQQVPPPSDSPSNHQMATPQGGTTSAGGTMALQNHHHHHPLHMGAAGPGAGVGGGGNTTGHHSLEHNQFTQAGHNNHHNGQHHHSHHHNHLGHHHQSPPPHHSSSLTYAHHHSRAALLHRAHHHQSSHHLSSVHQAVAAAAAAQNSIGSGCGGHNTTTTNNNNNSANNNKGGTMNSVGTHHSGLHPSGSPLPATPNTTNSSGLPPNHLTNGPLLPSLVTPSSQLPPTPCGHVGASVFAWPSHRPNSTLGGSCLPPLVSQSSNPISVHGSTLDCTPSTPQHGSGAGGGGGGSSINALPPAWIDLGASQTQLAMAHDLYGSYNWDYLSDWAPEYNTLMQLIQAEHGSY